MAETYQLVDQHGRPVKRAELTREVARPSLTGIRQIWAPSVASGLTPEAMAGLLRAAAEGECHDYLVLAEEMEERDAHYASVLGIRKRALSGIEPVVTAASEDARDQEIAEAVRDRIAGHDGFTDLVEDLMDGVGKGFAAVEIDWRKTASEWVPRGFDWRDPRHFRFDRETGRELRMLDQADMVEGVPLPPFKFIVHKPKLKSGLALRGGLARLVAFGWLCKAYTVKDWVAFVECYGLPLRLGRYGPSATADDVKVLHSAVANIGTDAAAVLPESMRIEFQEIADGAGNGIFEKLARWVDEQTSKAVLGQTMTSDDGSSQSQATVHNEVRHDVLKADARQIAASIGRDLVRPFVDLNYGVQDRYPRLGFQVAEPEDTTALVGAVDTLAKLGVTFKADELRAKVGLSAPEEGDEIVGGPALGAPAQTALNRILRRLGTATAINRAASAVAGGQDVYAVLDEIEAEAAAEWEDQLAPIVDPVQRLIAEAGSLEEVRRRLPDLVAEMETAAVIEGLTGALFRARADGELAD